MIALIAAVYGAANGMITIARETAVPEMVTCPAYRAVNGSLVAPMNIIIQAARQAAVPLAAAVIWQASGGYGTALAAILAGSLALCRGFWFAASKTHMRHPTIIQAAFRRENSRT